MGAWGVGPFENDDALDWLASLVDGEGSDVAEQPFADVLTTAPGYLERDIGARAIAAAELLAVRRGHLARDVPPELIEWIAANTGAGADDRSARDARLALAFVTDPHMSEIAELWAESPEYDAWRSAVDELLARLA